MMCELPSNAILAEQFLDYFDGFSLARMICSTCSRINRDSELISHLFDERDEAVKVLMERSIEPVGKIKYVGICGQLLRSTDLAAWLLNKIYRAFHLTLIVIPTVI